MSAQHTVARGSIACCALLAAALGGEAMAQIPFPGTQNPATQNPATQNPGTQNPGTQNPGIGLPSTPVGNPGAFSQAGQPNGNRPGTFLSPRPFGGQGWGGQSAGEADEFTQIWSAPSPPQWRGLPTFPARLQGYGSYPLPVDPNNPAGNGLVAPLPAAEPEPAGWPSWVRLHARKPLPFAIDTGLLIAQSGRAWFREVADEPFVPSMLHDKFASLPVGAEVEMRTEGAIEVLLHQSTRVEARGRTRLQVVGLDEENVALAFGELSWLRVHCSGRTNKVRLPDGSELEIQPAKVPDDLQGALGGFAALFGAASIPASSRAAMVDIERADEPSWYGGRATITNLGGGDVIWRHAFGETTIAPSQRVTFFLTPPATPASAALTPGDAYVEEDGQRAVCRAVSNTEVQWCGARIAVPAGTELRLESLAGPIRRAAAPGDGE